MGHRDIDYNNLFSIIVPVYNIEKYIEECICSILNQSYFNWELILVDDGSTDRSGEICKNYSSRDSRIQYVYKSNSGQSDARNMGVEIAEGDYLLFVDGDDYITSSALESLNDESNNLNSPDIIFTNGMSEVYEGSGEHCEVGKICINEYRDISGYDALLKGFEGELTWSPCGKAYKRIFWKLNCFCFPGGRISEDFTLIPKVILKAKKIGCVDNFYTYRRFRKGSSATDNVKKMARDDVKGFDDWEEFFVSENIDKELVDKFRIRFLKLYCHNTLAYLYLYSGDEKVDVVRDIKRYAYLLNYSHTFEEIIINLSMKLFGYKLTCGVLGIIKRYRLKKTGMVKD